MIIVHVGFIASPSALMLHLYSLVSSNRRVTSVRDDDWWSIIDDDNDDDDDDVLEA